MEVCKGLHVFIVKDILNKTEGGHCCLSHFLVLMPQDSIENNI